MVKPTKWNENYDSQLIDIPHLQNLTRFAIGE